MRFIYLGIITVLSNTAWAGFAATLYLEELKSNCETKVLVDSGDGRKEVQDVVLAVTGAALAPEPGQGDTKGTAPKIQNNGFFPVPEGTCPVQVGDYQNDISHVMYGTEDREDYQLQLQIKPESIMNCLRNLFILVNDGELSWRIWYFQCTYKTEQLRHLTKIDNLYGPRRYLFLAFFYPGQKEYTKITPISDFTDSQGQRSLSYTLTIPKFKFALMMGLRYGPNELTARWAEELVERYEKLLKLKKKIDEQGVKREPSR